MGHLTQAQWDKYTTAINDFHDDAFQQDVILRQLITVDDIHGEDTNQRTEDFLLKGLIQYNYFRGWPINQVRDSGEIDKESCTLYLNVKYLSERSLLNPENHLLFDPALDRFLIDGIVYKAFGDSKAAQAKGSTLLIFIILKREETNTGSEVYK